MSFNLISEEFLAWIAKIFIISLSVFYFVFSVLLFKKSLFMSRTLVTQFDHVINILTFLNLVAAIIITLAFFFISPI